MTQEPGRQTDRTPTPVPSSGSGFAFPPRAQLVRTSETIINPERRASADSSIETVPTPSSALCGVLFPNPEAIQQAIPNPAGVELGHFRILTAIRSGGMGAVFEALDTRLNRVVALKVLPPSQSRDVSSVQRFRNEAQAAAQLDHDNIARVYYIGEDKGLHFIAFEFIRGTNLREVVQHKGKLTPSEAVNYTLQVASALAHASDHGVVHRDIKPSNIIIMPSGRAKLVDLGLARSEHRENESELTVAGTTLGTFDYISPEQAKDPRTVDVRSDIYSLGCTLYHLLTGEPPYPQGTVLQKLLDHQGKEAPDPRLKNRRVSPELASIVKMMMASDARKRYQTAGELIRDLLFVANSLGLKSINSEGLMWLSLQNSPNNFFERHASWLAVGACLLMFVGYLQFGPMNQNNPVSPELAQAQNGSPFEVIGKSTGSSVDGVLPATAIAIADKPQILKPSSLNEESSSDNSDPSFNDPESTQPTPIQGERSAESIASKFNSKPGTIDSANSNIPSDSLPADLTQTDLTSVENVFGSTSDEFPVTPRPLVSTRPMGLELGPNAIRTGTGELLATGKPLEDDNSFTTQQTRAETQGTASSATPASPIAVVAIAGNAPKVDQAVVKGVVESISQFPIVLIKADGSPEQVFPTLEAACAIAQDGNVIELRFNGSREEPPVRIRNKITIRAGKGFRPNIEFIAKDIPASGYETRMITLTGGSLDLVDISLSIRVKDGINTDNWALISTKRTDAVRMQRVAITFENPSRRPACVMEFRGGASRMVSDMEMPVNMNQMSTSMTVRLADSMVRGGTDLFHVKTILSARLDVENSLLVLDGTLLRQTGSMDIPEKQPELSLRLYQLTAVLNAGLIMMESGEVPRQLGRVSIDAANNIFTTPTPAPNRTLAPLIMLSGNDPSDDLRKLVAWSGQKNFYDGFQSFWETRTAFEGPRTSVWDFEEWKYRLDSNEIDPHATIVLWKQPWSQRLFWNLTPKDFALDDTATGNPALSAANNGENAGVNLSTLEKLHVPPITDRVN